jgi:hypothetical protein
MNEDFNENRFREFVNELMENKDKYIIDPDVWYIPPVYTNCTTDWIDQMCEEIEGEK